MNINVELNFFISNNFFSVKLNVIANNFGIISLSS